MKSYDKYSLRRNKTKFLEKLFCLITWLLYDINVIPYGRKNILCLSKKLELHETLNTMLGTVMVNTWVIFVFFSFMSCDVESTHFCIDTPEISITIKSIRRIHALLLLVKPPPILGKFNRQLSVISSMILIHLWKYKSWDLSVYDFNALWKIKK